MRTGYAKIHPSRGLTVNGLHYWHERMRSPAVAGQRVPVRYEPYDIGVVYAFLDGQWLTCVADTFALVHGRSEREWQLILEEWRAQRRQQLQQLLGTTARGQLAAADAATSRALLPPAAMPPHAPSATTPSPQTTPRRRIERAPARDPVGTSISITPGNKCTFRGTIALVPAAMREAGVAKVECPECTTMQLLPLRGEIVRFPPHNKRKTRTPPREARWVRRGTTWELVGPYVSQASR